jgi:hypothetical protein
MKTTFRNTGSLLAAEKNQDTENRSPIPLDVIPNHMGINLVAVDGVSWTRQDDGQLVSLTVHFIPEQQVADAAE